MAGRDCKACGAPMLWARTTRGAAVPLDAEPIEPPFDEGVRTVYEVLRVGADGDPELVRSLPPHEAEEGGMYYRSHFETCPDADRF